MLKKIDSILRTFSPTLHASLKTIFRSYKKKTNPKLSKEEFISILKKDLLISPGDVIFVHSSMRSLYLDFDKQEILALMREVIGKEGTIIFPCWQFNIRAEDYIKENDLVFDLRNSPSVMGRIPDELRKMNGSYRSFHPTNSVVAAGKFAKELTDGHESDIYPCGERSPFHKLIKYKAKVVGVGVTVDNLTFVHTVEDTIKSEFPIETRNPEIYPCKCIDGNGDVQIVNTLVASKAIGHRDVFGFFEKHVPKTLYRNLKVKNMDFFSADCVELYDKLKDLALNKKSIYHF